MPGRGVTPRVSGAPERMKVPEKAIPLEGPTPNLPAIRPDGSLATVKSGPAVKYEYKDIKSKEALDKVLDDVSSGKKADEAVQLAGEMEEAVTRQGLTPKKAKVTFSFKKKMTKLGYEADEIADMNEKVAANITRFTGKKKEPFDLSKMLEEPITKIKESKIDLSAKLTNEEKLYNWAKSVTPQQRIDAVERGMLPKAVNAKIVKEQRKAIEKGAEYKAFTEVKSKASDDILESMGTGDKVSTPLTELPKKGESVAESLTRRAKELSSFKGEEGTSTTTAALGAIATAAATFSLADVFSPSEAEAMGLPPELGRQLSGLTATILKNAKPGKVKDLVKNMKESSLITPAQVDHCYVLPEPRSKRRTGVNE